MEKYTPESGTPNYDIKAEGLAKILHGTLHESVASEEKYPDGFSKPATILKKALENAGINPNQLTSEQHLATITQGERDELLRLHEELVRETAGNPGQLEKVADRIVELIKTFR